MGIPLRVLILEDRETDAQLMVEQLRDAGFDPDWRRVDTESEFSTAVNAELSLVLADYHLPQFDALQALQILRQRNLDLPVLVVTGALGDEAAVECLRQGAVDYLLKDRLARLGDAVKEALKKKQTRIERDRAEADLRRAHDELERRVTERTADLMLVNDNLGIEVAERRKLQESLVLKVKELQDALDQVKLLSGLLPICSYCKKIRDDENYWHQVDTFIRQRSDVRFSHGVCPDCFERVMQTEMKDHLKKLSQGGADKAV